MALPDIEASIVLTSSDRLAGWLLFQYNERQSTDGILSWPTPHISPLPKWLGQQWKLSWPDKFVLSNLQSLRIWEAILKHDSITSKKNLLHQEQIAKQALKAFRLAIQYRLPLNTKNFDWNQESQSFLVWSENYKKHLKKWKTLDSSMLLDEVSLAMRSGRIPFPRRKIIFVGFDQITPQLSDWIKTINNGGTETKEWSPYLDDNSSHNNIQLRKYADTTEETVQCARWLNVQSLQSKKTGIIVPTLSLRKNQIKREFSAELSPKSIFPWINIESPFTISQGTPLINETPVYLAIMLLSLPTRSIQLEKISTILKSPFLTGGDHEATQRSRAEWKLRKNPTLQLDEIKIDDAPQWLNIKKTILDLIQSHEKIGALGWAKKFSVFLKKIGWPAGDFQINEDINKIYEAWINCMDSFASLDRILGKMGRKEAAKNLTRITEEKLFQSNRKEQLIQIIDIEEAYGMTFDSIWMMNYSSNTIPAQSTPNPFIPIHLQKKYDLPNSSSVKELELAEKIIRNLLVSAREIVFSYPAWEGSVENYPSPLLKEIQQCHPVPIIGKTSRLIDKITHKDEMELKAEPKFLFPASKLDSSLKAGTSILIDQARCPFRAFTKHRLAVDNKITPEIDYDATNRGTVIHKALELFWSGTKNRAQLNKIIQKNQLERNIFNSVTKALNSHLKTATIKTQPRFVSLEIKSLTRLLKKWLEFEQTRPDFEVISSEENTKIYIAGMKINIRPDRIDRTPQGETIIFDYKTGNVNPSGWFDERIQEPQLPLYALKFKPKAIAFVLIKKPEDKAFIKAAFNETTRTKFFQDANLRNHAKESNWDHVMTFWKKHLTNLIQSFIRGHTEIDPFDTRKTCRNCGLENLCRINEIRGTSIEEEDE